MNHWLSAILATQSHNRGMILPILGFRLLAGDEKGLFAYLMAEVSRFGCGWLSAFIAPDGRNLILYQSRIGRYSP